MLLNHVVVGILLLPLGVLTIYAAPHDASWAKIVTRVVALAVATLPATLVWLMGTRYFTAVPFQAATAIVCVASLTLLAAAFWPSAGRPTGVTEGGPPNKRLKLTSGAWWQGRDAARSLSVGIRTQGE